MIDAGEGDDQITGLGGYDEIDGGKGLDIAVYRGDFKDYSVSRQWVNDDSSTFNLGINQLTITDNRATDNDGIDVVQNVEQFQFADQLIEESKIDSMYFYDNKFSDYKFFNENGIYKISTDEGKDDITGIPQLIFSDKTISAIVDVKGTFDQVTGLNTDSGKMFRLYNASFKRLPDPDGLRYWIGNFSSSKDDERAVASSFLASTEFKQLYGDNVSDSTYVNTMYQNVLGREADQGGLDYWLGRLDSGAETRYEVLLGFSESAENKALFSEMTGFV